MRRGRLICIIGVAGLAVMLGISCAREEKRHLADIRERQDATVPPPKACAAVRLLMQDDFSTSLNGAPWGPLGTWEVREGHLAAPADAAPLLVGKEDWTDTMLLVRAQARSGSRSGFLSYAQDADAYVNFELAGDGAHALWLNESAASYRRLAEGTTDLAAGEWFLLRLLADSAGSVRVALARPNADGGYEAFRDVAAADGIPFHTGKMGFKAYGGAAFDDVRVFSGNSDALLACADGFRAGEPKEPTPVATPDTGHTPDATHPGFYTKGRFLHAKDGEKVILRGVNQMYVWWEPRGERTLPEIEKSGSNVVRIMWMTGKPAADFDEIVRRTVSLKMIPMIELHDATGKWGSALEAVAQYWLRPDTVEVIKRHQEYLLVNIANEPGGDSRPDDDFISVYSSIVERMRSAGIHVPLVIDASRWGRDGEQLVRTGPTLIQKDPDHNLIFSVHWWDSDGDTERITRVFEDSVRKDIPFIVGEFAHKEVGCRGNIPYRHILAEAQRLQLGWMPWSWGGTATNADCTEMDMAPSGLFTDLHGWGLEVTVTDPNSIQKTSVRPGFIVQKSATVKP